MGAGMNRHHFLISQLKLCELSKFRVQRDASDVGALAVARAPPPDFQVRPPPSRIVSRIGWSMTAELRALQITWVPWPDLALHPRL